MKRQSLSILSLILLPSVFANNPNGSFEVLLSEPEASSVRAAIQRIEPLENRDATRKWGPYLKQRIRYIVGADFNPWERFVSPLGKHNLAPQASDAFSHHAKAENLSHLWLYRILNMSEFADVKLRIGFQKEDLSLETPNVGVVKLERAFHKIKFETQRMGILIHEARHSDCENGLEEQIVSELQKSQSPEQSSEILAQSSCTFPHSVCPEGHDLAGMPLCEGQVWGPNAVEFRFYKDFIEQCRDCTEQDKMTARILAMEAAQRILDLDGLYSGTWPKLEFSKKEE